MFVDTFVDEDQTRLLMLKAKSCPSAGIMVRVYVANDRCTYKYKAVYSENKSLDSKENLLPLGQFESVPIDLMACLLRFDSRFKTWLKGELDFEGLFFNDTGTSVEKMTEN